MEKPDASESGLDPVPLAATVFAPAPAPAPAPALLAPAPALPAPYRIGTAAGLGLAARDGGTRKGEWRATSVRTRDRFRGVKVGA